MIKASDWYSEIPKNERCKSKIIDNILIYTLIK